MILVTGGAGFIGFKLVRALRDYGHSVRVIDCLSNQVHKEEQKAFIRSAFTELDVDFIEADIGKIFNWRNHLNQIKTIVHLAAETGTGQSMYKIEHYNEVNCSATARLAEFLVSGDHEVTRVVVSSSRAIYGEGEYCCPTHGNLDVKGLNRAADTNYEFLCPICDVEMKPVPMTRSTNPSPMSIYGLTKYYQEQILSVACSLTAIEFAALRYQNVYGPGQSLTNPYTGILAIFTGLIKNGSEVKIFEDGRSSRDFVFVDDVVAATYKAASIKILPATHFDIGTGVKKTVQEIVSVISERLLADARSTITGEIRTGDIRHAFASGSDMRLLLGDDYHLTEFEKGISLFLSSVNEIDLPNISEDYARSMEELRGKGIFTQG